MKSKDIIRVGDRVRIVVPELFVRCGYPLTVQNEQEKIELEFGKDIIDLMEKVGLQVKPTEVSPPVFHKIAKELGYASAKQKRFGGHKREIYTRKSEELLGVEVSVVEVRFVKTGNYESGGYSGYEWEEYEPPCLTNVATHKILGFFHGDSCLSDSSRMLSIEAKNVEKVANLCPDDMS